MPLSDFLAINISTAPVAPTSPGFGVPIVLGACKNALAAFAGTLIRYYSGAAAMLTDGFLATDPEYLAAAAIFSQPVAPPTVAIGRRTSLPTHRFALTVLTAVVGRTYTVTVNGVAKSYTAIGGDTTSTIATALAAAIGTPTGFGAAAAVGPVVTLTAAVAGNWARIAATSPNVDIDCQQTHVDAGIATDIANIAVVDSTWYAVLSCFSSQAEVAALAAWTETNQKLYLADTQDSTILGAGAADIASTLKTSAYVRSPPLYHPDNGAFAAAAWAGVNLPKSPGSETWKFSALAGVATVSLSSTQVTNLKSKNCNYYYSTAGVGMTAEGITPSGQFVDTVRGRDALQADMQTAIFTALINPPAGVNPDNPQGSVPLSKIPFTDQGIAVVESVIRASLRKFVNNGFLASSPRPSVSAPKAAAVSIANKSARTLAPVSFTATIAGAIHSLAITGVVSF